MNDSKIKKIRSIKSRNFSKNNLEKIMNPRRVILNALENLELNNTTLKQKTTELQLSEQRILQKRALNEAILESIGDGLVVVD